MNYARSSTYLWRWSQVSSNATSVGAIATSTHTGYSNLICHLVGKHPSHTDDYAEFHLRVIIWMEVYGLLDPNTSKMYDWMRTLPVSRDASEVAGTLGGGRQQAHSAACENATDTRRDAQNLWHVVNRVDEKIGAEMGRFFASFLTASLLAHHTSSLSSRCTSWMMKASNCSPFPTWRRGKPLNVHIDYVAAVREMPRERQVLGLRQFLH